MPSFGSVGDAFDKTMMEAFWSRTQIEILSQRRRTRLELTNVVLDNVDLSQVAANPALWEKVLSSRPHLEQEAPLPTLISGDIALTSTPPRDAAGARAHVARRQPDGTWLRVLDQPEFVAQAEAVAVPS